MDRIDKDITKHPRCDKSSGSALTMSMIPLTSSSASPQYVDEILTCSSGTILLQRLFIMLSAVRTILTYTLMACQQQQVFTPLKEKNTRGTPQQKHQYEVSITDVILFCGTQNKTSALLQTSAVQQITIYIHVQEKENIYAESVQKLHLLYPGTSSQVHQIMYEQIFTKTNKFPVSQERTAKEADADLLKLTYQRNREYL